VVPARGELVDVVLHHTGGNHGRSREKEAQGHALDWGEVEADLLEPGVKEAVEDRNQDDDGDGVEVLDNIVGNAVQLHGAGLRCQVAGHLVVGEVEDGQEQEHLAGHEAAAYLVDPGIIVCHPRWPLLCRYLARTGVVPVQLLEPSRLVDRVEEHVHKLAQHRARGWGEMVLLLLGPEDQRRQEEEASRKQESEPEADVLLGPDHGHLADDSTDVDGEVEVEEDACVGKGGVENDALSLLHYDSDAVPVLLGKERRDVGLEEARTNTEGEEADDENAERRIRLFDDRRDRGNDENNVGKGGNGDGEVDGLVPAESAIGNPSTTRPC